MAPVKGNFERGRNVKKKNKSKSVKQQIRSTKRLLSKPDLPATVRVSQERMLNLLVNTLEEQQQSKKDGKMIKKYRMVKFFEKRKLWRQHRAATKELQSSPSADRIKDLEELQKKILKDLNYIEYFPSDRKYISLFPAKPYTNPAVVSEQEELYNHINDKVDAEELPQATLNKNIKDASLKSKGKNKVSQPRIHMDKRTVVKTSKGSSQSDGLVSSLDGDDFFIDTSGDQMNIE